MYLALFVQREKFPLRNIDYRNEEGFNDNILFILLQEIYELYSRSMRAIDGEAIVSPFNIIPSKMVIVSPAKSLYFLMGLGEVQQSDINALAEQLDP